MTFVSETFRCSAATPVPVAWLAQIHMNGFGMAVGADATAIRDGTQIICQVPLGNTADLNVGRIAGIVLGTLRCRPGRAISGRHCCGSPVMRFDFLDSLDQLRLETTDINLFSLHQQPVGRDAAKAGQRSKLH